MVGVYAARCVVKNCRGVVKAEVGDKDLYDQLCYYDRLMDAEAALEKAKSKSSSSSAAAAAAATAVNTEEEEMKILIARNRHELATLHGVAKRYLDRNGRRFVDLGKVFGKGARR